MDNLEFSMRLFYNDSYSIDTIKIEKLLKNKRRIRDLHATKGVIFPDRAIKKVPVLRFFGQTKRGQKACLNVFDYFPYFFAELPASVFKPSWDDGSKYEVQESEFLVEFAQNLELAIFIVHNSINEVTPEKLDQIQLDFNQKDA